MWSSQHARSSRWSSSSWTSPAVWIHMAWFLHSIVNCVQGAAVETVTISHTARVGHLVTQISTREYIIPSDSSSIEFHNSFEVGADGAVVTKAELHDHVGSSFAVVVMDNQHNQLMKKLHIKVERQFAFQQDAYVSTITENEDVDTKVTVIGHIAVPDFEHVTYSLLNHLDTFRVASVLFEKLQQNEIYAIRSLDREVKDLYELKLQAISSDQMNKAVTTISVHVLDVNDNFPVFPYLEMLRVRTDSHRPWDTVINVNAKDEDLHDSLTYRIQGNSEFMIDSGTGDIYKDGDYTFPGSYKVSVHAVDSAGHLSDELNIIIEVESDLLKFEPHSHIQHHVSKRSVITRSRNYEIVENSTSTAQLFSVASPVTPRSSTEKYHLVSASVDLFQQPDANGNVYLKPGHRLDYENIDHRQIFLTFNRTDDKAPEDIYILTVTLKVRDKNDEKPVFRNQPVPFLAAVSTNPVLGENVYTLYADDPDQNSNIVYQLESGGEGKFKLESEQDPRTGDMVGKIITTVSGPGQFTEGVEYTLVVSARDMSAGNNPPQKSDFALVKVRVGMRPPQLFENPFQARVYENSGTEYRILGADDKMLVVRAKCFQDVLENKLTFDLTEPSGKISSLFSITSKGNVETLQNLDFEDPPNQYVLNITATEVATGLSSSAQLLITVMDMNDNSPKFQLSTYTFLLPENTPVGGPAMALTVMATDRDSGKNGELKYSVSDDHFSIQTTVINNQYIGQIKVAKKLDYDFRTDHQYRFNVTATDKGGIPLFSHATVIVYVTNVNDEAPVFGIGLDHLYASISEEQTVGSVVTIIQATDPDGDNVKYYFSPMRLDSTPFRIDPDSGLVTLTSTLPESIPYYTLNITAYDDGACCDGGTTLSSQTNIIVEVKDTNNNQPQFEACNYEPEVLENQPIGTFVVQVKAIDNDRGANGNITYSIVKSPMQLQQFEVDPNNGRVVTAIRFDREAQRGDRGIPITVKAADQGTPQSLDSHCTFWVRISDLNDNPPVFDSPSYFTSISESSAVVGRRVFAVRATDKDRGKNAEVVYSLMSNPENFFNIEADTGIIYLQKGLHGQDSVVLRVKAEDRGEVPLSSFISVTISVTDRTNNPPTWDSDNYEREYEVNETALPGYIIATMRASSNMEAPFDGLSFALIDSMERTVQQLGPFSIYQDGTVVRLRLKGMLDYNVQNRYELRLRVTNQGKTPLSAEIRPVVVVKDMNNEPPQFEGLDPSLSNSYKGSVPENEGPNQTVIQIKAVDSDHDPPNNVVRYSLMEDRNKNYMHFKINSESGVITTVSTFDREQLSVYYINVMAIDGANSDAPSHFPKDTPNSATAQVQVIVSDKNDNPPYFTQKLWEISVPEQRPDSNGRILTVVAQDKDEGDQLAYTITEGNLGNVFGIKQKTGDIYVAKTLDYESPPTTYTLTVMVQDGRFENFTQVVIHVTDVNDNAPEFSENVYEITNVVENVQPPPGGQFLVQVSAIDKDVSRKNKFKFYISGDGTNVDNPTFSIEPDTGRIFLNKELDRDQPYGREVYQFNVIAEDEPGTADALFGYAYVKVMPMDVNDNWPEFSEKDLQGSVPEHSPAGQSVMTVVANDPDAGLNGTVYYEIDRFGNPPADPGGNLLFQINQETGLIQTKMANSLDREQTARYYLLIVAKDRGVEHHSSTATVTISVSDINDQKPHFVKSIYQVSMSENQVSGPVITVSATDNDIDENARLTYELKESDRLYFSIETMPPNAGVLTVFRPVDYEKIKSFNLTVYVQDSNPDHKDTAYIEVTVEDYNDNPPKFVDKVGTIKLRENVVEGTSLWNCSATDDDNGINADFEYSIDRKTDPGRRFYVTSNCEVKIRRGLDGETLDREALAGLAEEKYEVHILAIDNGYPPQTGTAILRIYVEDENDNAPELVLPGPVMVMENLLPPQFVVTFSARDRDTPKYGAPFQFSLPPCKDNPTCKDGNLEFTMKFDPNGDNKNGTGMVTAQKMFYRDQQKFHYMPIVMSDMRGRNYLESKTGTSTLTIEIGDENDHKHKPGHKDIFVYKYDFKGVVGDIVIGNVYAEDPDDWDVKDKHFYFLGPPVMGKYFSVDYDTGLISMNKQTPPGIHSFSAKVWDFRVFTDTNVTCTVKVNVVEITDEAIFSSGSLRFTGMTAEEFVTRPGPDQSSAYEKFRSLMADKLRVPEQNVEVFSVMNGKNNAFTDVRYAAHGSPWYPASKLDSFVALDQEEFETASGIKITMVNIDMCLREVCESGGCTNQLVIGDHPNYVNANGTAFIGIDTKVVAECQCRATDFSNPISCTPGYCFNGGQCVQDEWGDVKCIDCPQGFDGSRCQMTKHSFDEGYALFAPFEQCEESTTSIEFLAKASTGLLFYNGPVTEIGIHDPTDFIALSLIDGYPVLQLDHGSGGLTLTLDGRDRRGHRHLQKLDDGRWHHIDIIRKGKKVTMIVDRCDMTPVDGTADATSDRSPCEVIGQTPGDNYFLNVNTMLQLGGRYAEPSLPENILTTRFKGCVRNLVHSGQLYDLFTGQYSKGERDLNGCPDEEQVCGINTIDGPRCGPHGICEIQDVINKQYKCTCKPGYRSTVQGVCSKETTVRDLGEKSFMSWTLKFKFLNNDILPRSSEVQLKFRTRDPDGILLHLPASNIDEFITLEIMSGRVRVRYNLGGGPDGESYLSLSQAPASNGQWHTLYMRRIGRWFQLKMDGGEGRYVNETWGAPGGHQLININMYQIVSGAHVVFSERPIANGQDLNKTCITDIRLNSKWLPMINSENGLSEAAVLEYEQNVDNGCKRNDCDGVICPSGMPFSMVCFPLWGTHDCRCPPGTYLDNFNCLPINYCSQEPCFVGSSCITKPYPNNFTCVCPFGWTGQLCNILSASVPAEAGITAGFIVMIIVCIFVVLVVALLVYLIVRYKRRPDPDKYILDVDPEDDIRENIINYNEEGAGEEDQDRYDISRLRKPDEMDTFGKTYNPLRAAERYRNRAPGDHPDVQDFIEHRLNDADQDPHAPPHDSVREFVYEGGGSDAGSLSSLQTSSSNGEQDYDYLNDWGPKFSKLANMYGGEDEDL